MHLFNSISWHFVFVAYCSYSWQNQILNPIWFFKHKTAILVLYPPILFYHCFLNQSNFKCKLLTSHKLDCLQNLRFNENHKNVRQLLTYEFCRTDACTTGRTFNIQSIESSFFSKNLHTINVQEVLNFHSFPGPIFTWKLQSNLVRIFINLIYRLLSSASLKMHF